jgi:hypothetical protein
VNIKQTSHEREKERETERQRESHEVEGKLKGEDGIKARREAEEE